MTLCAIGISSFGISNQTRNNHTKTISISSVDFPNSDGIWRVSIPTSDSVKFEQIKSPEGDLLTTVKSSQEVLVSRKRDWIF
ncbi:2632_t:CDS:2 [Funneliformis geosporum]|uniref:2632_t:CDS:1 n=1 Tax=Funneliformis geosporum TaxID=1117311 RepID=A0A9W4WSP4_9GLOM|nr:2632_t:CDS:2 [Funneliformis geosporum]